MNEKERISATVFGEFEKVYSNRLRIIPFFERKEPLFVNPEKIIYSAFKKTELTNWEQQFFTKEQAYMLAYNDDEAILKELAKNSEEINLQSIEELQQYILENNISNDNILICPEEQKKLFSAEVITEKNFFGIPVVFFSSRHLGNKMLLVNTKNYLLLFGEYEVNKEPAIHKEDDEFDIEKEYEVFQLDKGYKSKLIKINE